VAHIGGHECGISLSLGFVQQDLAEFPGNMVIPKLLANNTPQWQTTI